MADNITVYDKFEYGDLDIVSVHDNEVISYNVNFKNKTIVLSTVYYGEPNKITEKTTIEFINVFDHLFRTDNGSGILFDIEICEIKHLIKLEQEWLVYQKRQSYLFSRKTDEEIAVMLTNLNINYYRVMGTCGLDGFVLAESMKITVEKMAEGI
jgi:hypothetical protein